MRNGKLGFVSQKLYSWKIQPSFCWYCGNAVCYRIISCSWVTGVTGYVTPEGNHTTSNMIILIFIWDTASKNIAFYHIIKNASQKTDTKLCHNSQRRIYIFFFYFTLPWGKCSTTAMLLCLTRGNGFPSSAVTHPTPRFCNWADSVSNT